MNTLSEELKKRGFIHQFSGNSLEEIVDGKKRVVYEGFDPSADSLHVGNLMGLLVLRRYLEAGHKVILLIGGGTGMIGDPSGKDKERVLLDAPTVARNAKAISKQAEHIFGSDAFEVVNNLDWLGRLTVVDFLRDIGKNFSVNAMLQRDAVKDRLTNPEQGISYTEFSYMLLQAYDYLYLHEKYGCDLQHGSSDQWGNITSGIDIVRRKTGNTVYGITHALLINKNTGRKFGKSEEGAVWLDAEKTSPYKFYQFWLNTSDEDVIDYLKIFTLVSLEDIEKLEVETTKSPEERKAQESLAFEVTHMVHGAELAESAKRVSEVLFGGTSPDSLSRSEKDMLISHSPSTKIKQSDVDGGLLFVDILVTTNLATSKQNARQLIEGGGVSFDGKKISSVETVLSKEDFSDGILILKKGKKDIHIVYY